jgi:acyl carrier protein
MKNTLVFFFNSDKYLKYTFIKVIRIVFYMSNVSSTVKNLVANHLGMDLEKVLDSAHFVDDLGADSLHRIELVMKFEEEFGIEINEDDSSQITTVGSAVEMIEKMLVAKA